MYRTIAASFWTDPKVKKLPAPEKLLFLYLITNPHTHVSGIYHIDIHYAAVDLGYPIDKVSRQLDTLSSIDLCRFDSVNSVVWVKKMMLYQGKGDKNVRSAAYHVMEDLHHSPLIAEFLAAYPAVKKVAGDRVSIRYPENGDGATPDSRSLIPIPEQEQERIPPTPSSALLHFGEFGHVRMTQIQFDKLQANLNGRLNGLINRLDRWGEEEPKSFQKKKSHYATIQSLAARQDEEAHRGHKETYTERVTRQNKETAALFNRQLHEPDGSRS